MTSSKVGWLLLLLLVLWTSVGSAGQATATEISLKGSHAFNARQDVVAFADPDHDDGEWERIPVPSSLRSAGIDPRPDVFWYRIRFHVPADWSANAPAIRLGIVERADETYLNGVRIGGEGQVGPRGSDWHIYPPILPRLYPFHTNLLVKGGENVLAVRVAREPYIDDGGIIVGPVALTTMPEALTEYLLLRQRFLGINYLLLGFETIIMLAALFSLIFWRGHQSVVLFLLLYLPYYLNSLERRNVLHVAGFDHPGLQFASNIIGGLAFPGLIAFVAHIFGHSVGRFGRFVQVASILALVSVPFTGIPLLDWWVMESALVWHALFLSGLLLLVFWSVRAFRDGKAHSTPLLIGLLALASTMIGDIVLPANYVEANYGFRLGEAGVLSLFLMVALIVGQRMLQTDRALLRANEDVLTAHEQERARLARDIHDSIGQWLTTIKLRLEMFHEDANSGRSTPADEVRDLVSDVSSVIDDTRRVAHDLSPAFLDEQGLATAMRGHAERIASHKRIAVTIDFDETLELQKTRRDHLYRFFQEALNNAATHSNGNRITVSVARHRSEVVLTVRDNGNGFDHARRDLRASDTGAGLGMKTMRDRARLLNGKINLVSNADRGTRIQLRFPISPT